MLHAIINGKAGRIRLDDGERRVSWREVFRRSEDLLTSVFFSRLRYLSQPSLHHVLSRMIGSGDLKSLGNLKNIDFWPRLDGADDCSWVEPDVRISFENADLWIEIKPPFGGQQKIQQLRNQISAINKHKKSEENTRKLIYLSLGGNNQHSQNSAIEKFAEFEISFHKAEWSDITSFIVEIWEDGTEQDRFIFSDWQAAFDLFGMQLRRFDWPELLAWREKHDLSNSNVHRRPLGSTSFSGTEKSSTWSSGNWIDLIKFSEINALKTP